MFGSQIALSAQLRAPPVIHASMSTSWTARSVVPGDLLSITGGVRPWRRRSAVTPFVRFAVPGDPHPPGVGVRPWRTQSLSAGRLAAWS